MIGWIGSNVFVDNPNLNVKLLQMKEVMVCKSNMLQTMNIKEGIQKTRGPFPRHMF